MRSRFVAVLAAAAVASLPTALGAHFKLLEPTSWVVENNLGDPQKAAPCGNPPAPRAAAGQPAPPAPALEVTNAVAKVVGGSKLHLKVQETIYHPGHYRVALAVNSRDELPPTSAGREARAGDL